MAIEARASLITRKAEATAFIGKESGPNHGGLGNFLSQADFMPEHIRQAFRNVVWELIRNGTDHGALGLTRDEILHMPTSELDARYAKLKPETRVIIEGRISREEDALELTVNDKGKGFRPEDERKNKLSSGLTNIRGRLINYFAHYGYRLELVIESSEMGTRATIRLTKND